MGAPSQLNEKNPAVQNQFQRLFLAFVGYLTANSISSQAADFYVATNGNDAWSGRLTAPNGKRTDGPFATLERARDELRTLKAAGKLKDVATVHLRGGSYPLERSFILSKEDSGTEKSPVVYRAYRREEVRLIGGTEITGFKPVTNPAILNRLEESARGKVLQADLKALGIADFGEAVTAGKRLELFFADQPMTLARRPNNGFVRIVEAVGGEPYTGHGLVGDKVGRFTYDGDRSKRWARKKTSGFTATGFGIGRTVMRRLSPSTTKSAPSFSPRLITVTAIAKANGFTR